MLDQTVDLISIQLCAEFYEKTWFL